LDSDRSLYEIAEQARRYASLASTAIVLGLLFAVNRQHTQEFVPEELRNGPFIRYDVAVKGKIMQQHILRDGQLLILREAMPDDAERLLAYIEQIAGESDNITRGPGEFAMTVEQEREFLQASAASLTSLYLVAEIKGEIAGALSFRGGDRPRLRHAGEFGISVLKKYWNLGIGRHLLAYLIDWAKGTRVIRKIDLLVRTDNYPAIHLYEKFGFVREGRITRHMYIHGEFIDCYAMGLAIDPPASQAR
jgi:RimJ/RimL family protein N-acetyltransferase